MKVPYAKKWQKEVDALRKMAVECDLREETKWGKACFTFQGKNVAIVIPLKDTCALSFFKGALIKDQKHLLQKVGEQTQAGRWIKFASLKEIAAIQSTLKNYLHEAIQVEKSGKRFPSRRLQSMPFLRSYRPCRMEIRSCGRHSKRSRLGEGSPTSCISWMPSRPRREPHGCRGVPQ